MWYKSITGRFFGLVTKHACDRQTDRQNYDSEDRASIAASRCKMDAQCDKLATELSWQRFTSKVANFQLLHLHFNQPHLHLVPWGDPV